MNSGVVSLAFTFDVPVIGPDEGVVGEIIKATGNICFTPGDLGSAVEALRTADSLSADQYQAMSGRIRDYRQKYMQWPHIAEQHIALYKRLRRFRKYSGALSGFFR